MHKPAKSLSTDARLEAGLRWANTAWRADPGVMPVAGDASFRRYFRLTRDDDSCILMDAPPARENSEPFVDIATRLRSAGVHAPAVLAADPEHGYLLLEDLGDVLLREVLTPSTGEDWMPRLFDLLAILAKRVDATALPPYDTNRLRGELDLFTDWYLARHKQVALRGRDLECWRALCAQLVESAQQQPQVFVHRDFHSANLLLTPDGDIGVIDFQDAVCGPLTYDLASLLWDRYIPWPRQRLETWMERLRLRLAPETSRDAWVRWCDWMGLQRNLKIVGIFARLHYRDGKTGYLEMIPGFWGYVQDVLERYPAFDAFNAVLERVECAP